MCLEQNEDEIKEKFFVLKSNSDLADLLEVSTSTLIYYAYRIPKEKQYREYKIPKRNGKERAISAPTSKIKILQRKLNHIFQIVYSPRNCSYAFVRNRNVIMNAREHKNSRVILKIDLKDFFEQVHFGRVRGVLMSKYPFGFNENVATTIANLCTYKASLPQGAPTSPSISNMICWGLDKDLQDLARSFHCNYTRYADDISISTKSSEFPEEILKQSGSQITLGNAITSIFSKHQLEINYDKVTLYKNNKRQLVTGLVVNDFVNVKREYVRQIRRELYIWEKYGLGELANKNYRPTYKNPYRKPQNIKWSIQGKLNFLKQVKGADNQTYKTFRRWFDYLEQRDIFENLKTSSSLQSRGYSLEDIFNRLFKINEIDVKKPFRRNEGLEQIDGAFASSRAHFIVECKWTDIKDINEKLEAFITKVDILSGKGTKGLFISIKGWNQNTIKLLQHSRNIILIDGNDFETILNNRDIEIDKLVEWKLNALMVENKPYVSAKNFRSQK